MLESPHHQYQLCTHVQKLDGSGNQATSDIIQNGIKTHNYIASASLLGDHSVCAPPDPISNSAVKPVRANGTNAQALEE